MKFAITKSAFLAVAYSKCRDASFGYTDITQDGCDWYEENPQGCGLWNGPDFNSDTMCCACGGGITHDEEICHDSHGSFGDSHGDGCEWYNAFPSSCGAYDTEDFIASEMCCSCQGGCLDVTFGATDSGGDSCAWYKENQSSCGAYDTETFRAKEMCCSC